MPRPKRTPKAEATPVVAPVEVEKVEPAVEPKAEVAPVVAPVEVSDGHPVYVVTKGHCIACRKGILKPGELAEAKDFGGGEQSILDHVKNGGLVEK